MRKTRLLIGISLSWLALSALFDGINTLLLPERLLHLTGSEQRATTLGLLSFVGLAAGMLIQPLAGTWSDWLRPRWGRKSILIVGCGFTILALLVFGFSPGFVGLAVGYLLVQISASIAQAAQQGFIPDQVPAGEHGLASGFKNFMDIGGAMVGFLLLGSLLGEGKPTLAVLAIIGLLVFTLIGTILLVREARLSPAGVQTPQPGWNAFRLDLRQHQGFLRLVISRFFFLLGTYAVGRFLLLFISDRLRLSPENAAEQAGGLLAGLSLITVLGAPLAGWAADRIGRVWLMMFGALASLCGVLAYIFAADTTQLFLFGGLLSLGSAAFASANWAMTADIVPKNEPARFFGLANFGTAGAAAAAGLFGPLVDGFNRFSQSSGYTALFIAAATAFALSALSLRGLAEKEAKKPMAARIPVTAGSKEGEE